MSPSRIVATVLTTCTVFALTACQAGAPAANAPAAAPPPAAAPVASGNPITGEGLPNPAPNVTRNWGQLPQGRKWGTTAGIDVDPGDGHIWAYERCGAGTAGGGPVDCDNTPVDPIFKFDRTTGAVLANFGKGVMVTPHGLFVDAQGNVWVTDFAGNKDGTKGHQVHKFSPKGEKLLSLGTAGKPGNADGQFNQPNDVVVGPDGSIYVSDGHDGQNMTTSAAVEDGLKRGATGRISKFSPDGKFLKSWGTIGVRHGEFRTPHALAFDGKGRLWVADRGNHRIEIFDQDGKYLESRYAYGRVSGIFIKGSTVYAIDSESGPFNHVNWRDGVRIGPLDEDRIVGFIPPFERDDRVYQGTAGEGIVVDADGNVFAAEGPNSLAQAGGAFTKYSVK
ncbi:MAG: peptidyl-alpha-hydroxyglycine alpha-amidating lyase family protein [Vicinamibacterales bacterium]